ncbi:YagK/YfjJ domain-containing protein [Chitinimonas naiadis]
METSHYADVNDQMLISTCIRYMPNPKGDSAPLILEGGNASRAIKHGTFLAEGIIKSKEPIFGIRVNERTGKATIEHSELAKNLISFMAKDIHNLPIQFGQVLLHPYTKLSLWLAFRCEGELRYWWNRTGDVEVVNEAIQRLNRRVNVIRRASQRQTFRNLVNSHTRRAKENFASCADLMAKTFEAYSKCLILRVDLLTRMYYSTPEGEKWIRKALKKFIRNLSENRIVADVLSYILKREHGIEGGRHYHLLVAINGHEHSADINLAKIIGEYWERCITPEFGSYFNCQAHPDRYKRIGIGLIDVKDTNRLHELKNVIAYLTKTDYFICHNAQAGTHNLWKSHAPKRKSTAGAKRESLEATREMRFILTGRKVNTKNYTALVHARRGQSSALASLRNTPISAACSPFVENLSSVNLMTP